MTLNETLRFEAAPVHVVRAFLRTPEKVKLPARTQLYKWTDRALGEPVSAWWSVVESKRLPSGATAEGFRVSEERALRLGRSHREFARMRAAISDQFDNPMSNLLVVALQEEVWGFAGQASGQREFKDNAVELQNVMLIGGAWQVWVPNLRIRHVAELPVRG
jgi:hypothetical protein